MAGGDDASAAVAYRAHVACSVALRDAMRLGHRVSEMLANKRAPPGFKPAFRRALARQPPFLTGASHLRHALDCMLCVDVDRRQEQALRDHLRLPHVVDVYYGWDVVGGATPPLDTGSRQLRMADLPHVSAFVAAMRAALVEVARVGGLHASDARRQLLELLAARHARALTALEDRVRDAAAEHIQTAWRRAWYQPGMGVWRRRMLREFDELLVD